MRHLNQLIALCLCATSSALGQHSPIPSTAFTLPNGLRVVVNEDHSVPIVAVDVWYRLGSADEQPRQAGFAHACEHLMATGTKGVPGGAPSFFLSVTAYSGTAVNAWATTTADYTRFYETTPTPRVDTVLSYEADRMRHPFARADSAVYKAVRDVVRQEHAQRVDNQPYGTLAPALLDALYPVGNPYREAVVPPMARLDSASLEEVEHFCRPYYVPSNAVLALSGDITVEAARRSVKKSFGDIANGHAPVRPTVSRSSLPGEQRLVLTDARARVSAIRFAWPAVGFSHSDKMPLYALAGVLSGRKYGFDRFGRLSRVLIDEKQLATTVHAELYDAEGAGDFMIEVSPRPGASLTTIETTVDSVISSLRDQLVDPSEIIAFARLNGVRALTSLQPRSARSDTLAQSELWAHDPNAFAKQLASADRLTPEDIRRVARQYLTASRVVISLVPAGKLGEISKPEMPFTDVTPGVARQVRP